MAGKIREITLSLGHYLDKVKNDDISGNQDVQRMFCWDDNATNELIVSVLTHDYIPPIILGEEEIGDGIVQQYIVDGMQRSSALARLRYGNYKVTSKIEDSIIKYQVKVKDENGRLMRDENGAVVWKIETFDIKGKTFDMFPDELKKAFDDYQIRIAIHQNCCMEEISKLVRRYNNHRAMNSSQRAFTYIDKFARRIKTIAAGTKFFKNCTDYSDKERVNGTYERLVCESIMTTRYLNDWKRDAKSMNLYLNANATDSDFNMFEEYASRMEAVCKDNFQNIFTIKDINVWFAVFDKFAKLGLPDNKFAEFLSELKANLHSVVIEDSSYDSLNKVAGTKNKAVIIKKIDVFTKLMLDFLHINNEETNDEAAEISDLDFLKQNVARNIDEEDVEIYKEDLEILSLDVDNGSKLLEAGNLKSMLGIIAYCYANDIIIDDWFKDYFSRTTDYITDQLQNFRAMVSDINNYSVASALA